MKLVRFTCPSGKIGINPDHVVTVRAAETEKGKATVFLATGGQITVDGTVDEVTDKLCPHDSGS